MLPILTREALLDIAGIQPAREVRRSHAVIKKAHRAVGKDRLPDERAIRAAELNLKLMDAFPKPSLVPVDASRPVNVVFVLSGAGAQDQLQADGLTLSLGPGAGASA